MFWDCGNRFMFKLVILANEDPNDHLLWLKACERQSSKVSYRIVDLTKNTWLEEIRKDKIDFLLSKPGGVTEIFKKLYDERLQILVNQLNYRAFPSLDEVLIYENKRYLSFWLAANNIPHPQTNVFYYKEEALHFIESSEYPIVAKLNIGASGNGVTILRNIKAAQSYIDKVFSIGVRARTGPRLDRGSKLKRLFFMVSHPSDLAKKIRLYSTISSNPQLNFCIFQEFIHHTFEWRVVRIGDSFFAHKKILKGEKASGSLIKEYGNPPLSLLSFVKEITDRYNFRSQAVDLFETEKDTYLINELQCIFGQSDPWQMLVDGKPGRYININDIWVFEEGMFNTNESYDLRLEEVLRILNEKEK